MDNSHPPTRTVDVTDRLAGIDFADPYRWLEGDTDEVRRWQTHQGAVAQSHVRQWPHFERLKSQVDSYTTPRLGAVPRLAAGQWFRMEVLPGASQAQVIVAPEPFGAGRVLFDPAAEDPARPPFVSWISPSPDATVLAIGVCSDGSEQNTMRLITVATGETMDDGPSETLMDNWTGGAQWLSDSSGFFYTAIDGESLDFEQQVFLHLRRAAPQSRKLEIPWTTERDYKAVVVSADGAYAVAIERLTSAIPVAVAALDADDLEWKPFITQVEGTVCGQLVGERFIAVTDVDAPRGRVVAIELDGPNPNDPASWVELVAESEAVIQSVTVVGGSLYLSEFVDTYARVRVVDHTGLFVLPLPGLGAIAEVPFPLMTMASKVHSGQFLFAFSSLTASWGIYSHHPGADAVVTIREPDVSMSDVTVEDRWATSSDGTRIPYHLVHRADVDISRPQPVLMNAYGGFNVPWIPQFPGPMAAVVAAGGIFVHGHVRGGSEFGTEWWSAGRLENKQNCYQDLYAIAEDLIAAGNTTSSQLAFTGGSNGGLMAGVALTQRPDLWAAVIPRVPLLDLIGAYRYSYGHTVCATEYGDPTDPEDVLRVAGFSPYHLVERGTEYPAVYLDAGDTDPRCPPWHVRKFGARLQASTSSQAPVLIRIWDNVGHGWATDRDVAILQNAEWLAFTMQTLGLEPCTEAASRQMSGFRR